MFNYVGAFFSSNNLHQVEEYDNTECSDYVARTYTVLESTPNTSFAPQNSTDTVNVENYDSTPGPMTQSNDSSDIQTNVVNNSE